ncbi:hypothetical protein D1BOALGB6SA_7217 [Olavius sp. associated proteobacterium Delta 1]|nr:hypothetical protein D1BOALGB6SA_7217 [Olavius sp. associated proteobacterium Delta 1]
MNGYSKPLDIVDENRIEVKRRFFSLMNIGGLGDAHKIIIF